MKTAERERQLRELIQRVNRAREAESRLKPHALNWSTLEWMCHEIEDYWYGSTQDLCDHEWGTPLVYVEVGGRLMEQTRCKKCLFASEKEKVTQKRAKTDSTIDSKPIANTDLDFSKD